jgi:hypothetical protein
MMGWKGQSCLAWKAKSMFGWGKRKEKSDEDEADAL